MTERFKIGDHVSWNSESGRVSGRIIAVHTKDVPYKGYVHHASAADPQYEIQSDKTDHVAMHKGAALRKFFAWVRTANRSLRIFKSNGPIFLSTMATSFQSMTSALRGQKFANEAGLVFILHIFLLLRALMSVTFFSAVFDVSAPP